MAIQYADRLKNTPKYMFTAAREKLRDARQRGIDVIDFGVGDPDMATPRPVVDKLIETCQHTEYHRYPTGEAVGMPKFRQAVAHWMQKRFGLFVNPESEITSLIGAKEAFHYLGLAFLNPGDVAIVPSPGYNPYVSAAVFAGAEVFEMPLKPENGFRHDLADIPAEIAQRAKLMFINYPTNPTATVATQEMFEQLVEFANQHEIVLINDAAYCELYLDEEPPLSLLEIEGARECALEIYSLTKSFNMAGWRIGMAAGNPDIVAGLVKMKDHSDSGVFGAIQEAGIVALEQFDRLMPEIRTRYKTRRDKLIGAFRQRGIAVDVPQATCYIWSRVPEGYTDAEFSDLLLENAGIFVLPGAGYGTYGKNYFRLSLTVPDEQIEEAVRRIEALEF